MNKLYSVHDHWTDINKKNDVDIESIDGVITGIKVNGEDYGGGSSDFSTAEVTIIVDIADPLEAVAGMPRVEADCISSAVHMQETASATYLVPLYKGKLVTTLLYFEIVSYSGNITFDEEVFTITGDCTITVRPVD